MSALVERLIVARDRIKLLTFYGEDAVWRPAKEAHECMADAANAISDLAEALANLRRICSDIPAIERNPKFADASRATLAALSKLEGKA